MPEQHIESRREFLKQAGTIAWATPLILTLGADKARAQAVSCAPPGHPCGTWEPTLEVCLPVADTIVCCNSCEKLPHDDMYCYCS